mgnify:CR=1 FL=1
MKYSRLIKINQVQLRSLFLGLLIFYLSGCVGSKESLKTVEYVDIERFMGDWYVIANIPTFIEEDAHNALEKYVLNSEGSIDTTFTFNKGSFNGPIKKYSPTGYIFNTKTNAEWGMQFIWPIKADYRVIYLNDDYSQTIIGRNKLDYVWIMARTPQISKLDYDYMISLVSDFGYDLAKIKKIPQLW